MKKWDKQVDGDDLIVRRIQEQNLRKIVELAL